MLSDPTTHAHRILGIHVQPLQNTLDMPHDLLDSLEPAECFLNWPDEPFWRPFATAREIAEMTAEGIFQKKIIIQSPYDLTPSAVCISRPAINIIRQEQLRHFHHTGPCLDG